MQQQSQRAQSSASMTVQSAMSHHSNSAPEYFCGAEGSANELKRDCQAERLCQPQSCPQGQQLAEQGPEQSVWRYQLGQDQRQPSGSVQGSDMPLGLEVLQQLNQRHGMSSHSAQVESEAATFPFSGSIPPERVAFVSQV